VEPVLELRSVTKCFGTRVAVDAVSLVIPRGAFYSLLGPSGCGKTTMLRLIAGFETPDAGEVLLNGARVNELPPYRRNVSTVFQSYALFPHLSVAGNIEFGLRQAGLPKAEIARRVERALELVELPGAGPRRPDRLSGGEKQRVALARSLVLEPDVLLLDEPLAALDERLRREMRLELKRLQRAVGISFLFVTHDQEEALTLSDVIAVMNNGRLEQVGAPEEIYRRPRSRFVAAFIGSSNLIQGKVTRVESGRVELTTSAGRAFLALSPSSAPIVGSEAALLVRPELVRVANAPPPAEAQRVSGKLVHTVFLGPHHQLTVEVEPGLQILAIAPPGCVPAPGSTVDLWWALDDALILTSDS
jgi:spermidine/putrescine transport system ATP-binding protein